MTDTNISHALTAAELDALATTAVELWSHANQEEAAEYLSSVQLAVLDKARGIYAAELDGEVTYTREAVEAAWDRAYGEAESIAGEDAALDAMFMHGIGNQLGAGEAVTRAEAVRAFGNLADDAKAEYNPDGGENGDTIRSDSCGDLVANLAGGFLDNPQAEAFDVIADAWKDLNLADGPAEKGPERDAAIVAEVTSWF